MNDHKKVFKFDELSPYVREVGLQKGNSWKNRSRKIYDHQYMYCFTGNAHIIIAQKEYSLMPGSLILIRPNIPHTFWIDDNLPGELYYVHFDYFYRKDAKIILDFYDNLDNYVNLFRNVPLKKQYIRKAPIFEGDYSFPEYIRIEETDKVETIFRSMYKSFIQKESAYDISDKIYFCELLQVILNQTNKKKSYSSANHRMIVAHMKNYIARNYYRKLKPREVALSTNLCIDHASRIFKKITGIKLVDYIAKFRISKAKELMLEDDLSIEQIAYMVGFDNQNYFSRTVKKYEGLPPATLRNMLKSELEIH